MIAALTGIISAFYSCSTALAQPNNVTSYVFTTVAGQVGKTGSMAGTAAKFNDPTGIAIDATGNIYVADSSNHTIRKISVAGNVSTFAGLAGEPGAVDGQRQSEARFQDPTCLAFDASGNLYVSEYSSHTIRKISVSGIVTTFAGTANVSGSINGSGSAARFNGPYGIAVDALGNVYVADSGNSVVRKITPAGLVTTYAGLVGVHGNLDGIGLQSFYSPSGMVMDAAGNLFVTDSGNHNIKKVTSNGFVSTFAGPNDPTGGYVGDVDGVGNAAGFSGPVGLAIDQAGNLYVADTGNSKIRKITPAAAVSTLAGSRTYYGYGSGYFDGTGVAAQFSNPFGVATDTSGNLYVTDPVYDAIRKVTPTGVVTTLAGQVGYAGSEDSAGAVALFNSPYGIAVDGNGAVYVADQQNYTVRKIAPSGSTTIFGGRVRQTNGSDVGLGKLLLASVYGLAVDQAGNVYLAETGNSIIRKIDAAGTLTTLAGSIGIHGKKNGMGADAYFDTPLAVAVSTSGDVYVADAGNRAIRKVTSAGVVTTFAEGFLWPSSVAVDSTGNVYVSDSDRNTIYRIAGDGAVRIFAGSGSYDLKGAEDGQSTDARFHDPRGISVDLMGNVYVADTGNQTIRKIDPSGKVTTIGGLPLTTGSADGIGTATRFSSPSAVAVNFSGTLFITDTGNHTIREGVPPVAPAITTQPTSRTVSVGSSVTFTATAAGLPSPTFQWQKDGQNIPGATNGSYSVARVEEQDAGVYTVVVTNAVGTVTSLGATLVVKTSVAHLVNISARGYCGTGDNVMIGGFVVGGSEAKRVLVRAVGPSLTAYQLPPAEVLEDPVIEVHHGTPVIAANDDWSENANAAEITAATAQLGAAALLTTDKKSSALLLTLQPGAYTFLATGKGGSAGIVLLEVYDADPTNAAASFVNISTRAYDKSGNGVTIGGFVISGGERRQVLLRAVGPTLTNYNLSAGSVLPDPIIELHDASHGNVILATNDNWGTNTNAGAITTSSTRIGAAPFDVNDGKSSALLLSLDAGAYTFIASDKSGNSGIVLVEIYDAEP